MEEERRIPKKGKKKYIFLFLITIVLGILFGVYYVDTYYGQGQIKKYIVAKLPNMLDTQVEVADDDTEENTTQENTTQAPPIKPTVEKYIALEPDSKASFRGYGNGFFMTTKDGVKFLEGVERQKWSDTFTMVSPVMTGDGAYIAVGDLSGRTIRVYKDTGLVYTIQGEGRILQFAVNSNGYLGVISDLSTSYKVMIYDNTGKEVKGRAEETPGIYPLALDISDDNRVFAITYLDTTDIDVVGRALFFYIDAKEGESYTDSMFAAVEKTGSVLAAISCMGNSWVAIGDDCVFGIDNKGVEKWSYPINNKIDFFTLESKDFVGIALGDPLTSQEAKKSGTVCIIDSNGKELTTLTGGGDVTYLRGNQDGVVFGVGREYTWVKTSGKVVFSHKATQDVKDILTMGKDGRILYATRNEVRILDVGALEQKRVENVAE